MANPFAPAQVDFSMLANLPNIYAQGQEVGRQRDLRNAFSDGLPMQGGVVDFNAMAQVIAPHDPVGAARIAQGQQGQHRPTEAMRNAQFFGNLPSDDPRMQFAPKRNTGTASNLSHGEKATDSAFAKDYADWSAGGGYADIRKQLDQLREVKRTLETPGADVTGGLTNILPDSMRAYLDPDSVSTQEAVEEVVQRSLRQILGAQFTEKEGERLIKRAYNPMLDEKENAKRVGRLIDQLDAMARSKESASRHFAKHGTLKGWTGNNPSLGGIDLGVDQTVPKSQPDINPDDVQVLPDGTGVLPDGTKVRWVE